jgi:hypothetical protein
MGLVASMGYIFHPEDLQAVARRWIGAPHRQMVAHIIDDLARACPGHVNTKQDWLFNIAGGATGIMTILHGSLSEYVIVFGTPVGTEGFSGRYWVEIYDIVLAGEMWTYTEERFHERTVHQPGELALLKKRQVKGFRLSADCWLLEYGRGPTPTALPMAVSGALMSLDAKTTWKTLRINGKLAAKELLHGKI